jgi:HEAT repeat protein
MLKNKHCLRSYVSFVAAALMCAVAWGTTLTERLVSQDAATYEAALREFRELDSQGKEKLIPELIHALRRTKISLREFVRRYGDFPLSFLDYWGSRWHEDVPGIRLALTKIGSAAVPAITEVLRKDRRAGVRDRAARILWAMGPQAEGAIPALREAVVKDRHRIVRLLAARALCAVGPTAEKALSNLNAALEHKDADVRKMAVVVLDDLGEVAVPTLVGILRDSHEDIAVRQAAINSLAGIGPGAVPHLIQALKDRGSRIRSQAAHALNVIKPPPEEAVPALIEALNDPDSSGVRQTATYTLSRMGPVAEEAFPLLIRSGNNRVRESAVELLGQLGAKEHKSEIAQLLNDDNSRVCYHAVLALARLGAKEYTEEIAERLKDDDAHVKAIAAWALQQLRARD